jgi:hypothetical protein
MKKNMVVKIRQGQFLVINLEYDLKYGINMFVFFDTFLCCSFVSGVQTGNVKNCHNYNSLDHSKRTKKYKIYKSPQGQTIYQINQCLSTVLQRNVGEQLIACECVPDER